MAYMMQPPDELMTGLFLPAMRQLVATHLRSKGLSQNRISALMGVTQASVSLYLSSDPKKAYYLLSRLSTSQTQAEKDSALLADAILLDSEEGVRALNEIWTSIVGSGSACAAHRQMYPMLANCEFCMKEYGGRGGAIPETVSEVAEAVRLLERSPDLAAAMPEVSVNLACAAGDAATAAEVVAIPGRIVKVKGRAKAMAHPEAGASDHMSRMLLIARKRRPELRACINLRYDRKMAAVLTRSRLRTLAIVRHPNEEGGDPTAVALEG